MADKLTTSVENSSSGLNFFEINGLIGHFLSQKRVKEEFFKIMNGQFQDFFSIYSAFISLNKIFHHTSQETS